MGGFSYRAASKVKEARMAIRSVRRAAWHGMAVELVTGKVV